MLTFYTDQQAWSALPKTIGRLFGNLGITLVMQFSPVLRPLSLRNVDKRLTCFRNLLIGDSVPIYAKRNPLDYVTSGEFLGTAYQQYLIKLDNEVIKRCPDQADQGKMHTVLKKYNAAQKELTTLIKDARQDRSKKKANLLPPILLERTMMFPNFDTASTHPAVSSCRKPECRAPGDRAALAGRVATKVRSTPSVSVVPGSK